MRVVDKPEALQLLAAYKAALPAHDCALCALAQHQAATGDAIAVRDHGMVLLNRRYYRFLHAKRGAWFAARAFVLRLVQDLGNGLSFAAGTALFVLSHQATKMSDDRRRSDRI